MNRIIPIHASPAITPTHRAGGAQGSGLTVMPPLSIYVHIPWCVRKCPYCDFNSHEARADLPEAEYVAALIADLESALPQIWGRRVVSIFIGGGTPSLFSAHSIDTLLTAIRTRVNLLPEAEITLEANPGTVEASKFEGFRAAGINRVSLGIQSFNERHLKALGRVHDSREARRAIELALTHFERVNIDLMYALPEQTLEEARADIDSAISFGTNHLSAYHLTLEPNTLFHHAPPPLPDHDLAADMQDMVEARLVEAGFEHYETSAFAKPGFRCQHNLNYWTFGDYLGIGAGAHSKLSSATEITREMRFKQPRAYLEQITQGQPVQETHRVPTSELPFEFMMNALRLNQGFPLRWFMERTGLPMTELADALERATRHGFLGMDSERLAPTERGRHFLNDLLDIFLNPNLP